MKNPAAHHMQRGSENQSTSDDSTAPQAIPSSDLSTATAAQLKRILQALRAGPKTTDELRALGIYQVSARIFGLRALGYSVTTDLFDGYAADGMHHARLARYTLNEPADCEGEKRPQVPEEERFALLAAQFAPTGHALVKAKAGDGPAPYYVARWGWLRPVHTLDQAEQLLEKIRGAKS